MFGIILKTNKFKAETIQSSIKYILREYFEALFFAILLAFILRAFVISAYRIPSAIMSPTLVPGDLIFAYRFPFGLRMPFTKSKVGQRSVKRGEVVLFPCPQNKKMTCLRRVVAKGGDRVEIRGKRLLVNGIAAQYERSVNNSYHSNTNTVSLSESWGELTYQIQISANSERENFGPIVVQPGELFVLSDNRDLGNDSRDWGGVEEFTVEAKASMVWLSLNWAKNEEKWSPTVRWQRMFLPVD